MFRPVARMNSQSDADIYMFQKSEQQLEGDLGDTEMRSLRRWTGLAGLAPGG